jgi:hypothetical protein
MHIEITKVAYDYIYKQTELGYDSPYKQERLGFLFGIKNNDVVRIIKAVAYKGGYKARSRVDYYADNFARRANALASELKMTWLGTYHSHVEDNEDIFLGLSDEDKDIYIEDAIPVALTISIWATDDSRVPPSGAKRITDVKRFGYTNYRFVVSGYLLDKRGPRLVRLIKG